MKMLEKYMTQGEAIEVCKKKGWRLPTPREAKRFMVENPNENLIFWTNKITEENHDGIKVSLGAIATPHGISKANSLFKFRVRVIK